MYIRYFASYIFTKDFTKDYYTNDIILKMLTKDIYTNDITQMKLQKSANKSNADFFIL